MRSPSSLAPTEADPMSAARQRYERAQLRRRLVPPLALIVLALLVTNCSDARASVAPVDHRTPLPAACTPSAALAQGVAGASSPVVLTTGARAPLKDLGIQPALLTRPQWRSLLTLARQAGVGVVNVTVGWASLEPDGPTLAPQPLQVLDEFVRDAKRQHIAVRLQLAGFPQWARDQGDPSENATPWFAPTRPDELSRWAGWVRAMVRHFGTTVSFYEIWNEENTQQFWTQGPDPVAYAALLACSDVAAKSVDPKATIVSGGLSTNDIGYLQHLMAKLASYPDASSFGDFFDVLGVHPYSGGRSPAVNQARWTSRDQWGLDDTNFLGFLRLEDVLADYGEGSKPLYIGEYGAPVEGFGSAIPGFTSVSEGTPRSVPHDGLLDRGSLPPGDRVVLVHLLP